MKLRDNRSFLLTFISTVGVLILGYRGTDIAILLPTILGLYITNRSAQKVSAHWATSKNPDCHDAIKSIEGLEK